MLLDEIFDQSKRIKKAWVRRQGQLTKVEKEITAPKEAPKLTHPMFPIKKPRHD
jgi:hypothetical protein